MRSGAAIAVILAMLPLPALAQRGSTHGGGFGNPGFGGQSGSSARPGFSGHVGFVGRRSTPESGGYAPAAPFRYGSLGPPPAVRFNPPNISAPHIGVGQNGIITSRPVYRAGFADHARVWDGHGDRGWDHGRGRDGDHDRDRDRFHGRARSFENRYVYSYPGWVGYSYPYVVDPGFYDSSDYDNPGYDQNNEASGYDNESPDSQAESPNGNYAEPDNQSSGEPGSTYGQPGEQPPPWPEPPASEPTPGSHFSVSGLSAASAPALEGPLTVIFSGGRAPEKMQNYMLTATALTDLDAGHYEQIPLTQIDLAATARANHASGMEFRIPGASRD
jgi:hypothetical protein